MTDAEAKQLGMLRDFWDGITPRETTSNGDALSDCVQKGWAVWDNGFCHITDDGRAALAAYETDARWAGAAPLRSLPDSLVEEMGRAARANDYSGIVESLQPVCHITGVPCLIHESDGTWAVGWQPLNDLETLETWRRYRTEAAARYDFARERREWDE